MDSVEIRVVANGYWVTKGFGRLFAGQEMYGANQSQFRIDGNEMHVFETFDGLVAWLNNNIRKNYPECTHLNPIKVQEHIGINVGSMVKPKLGPWKGISCKVLRIELMGGAKNGWFTVEATTSIGIDTELLFAGEEIEPASDGGFIHEKHRSNVND